ncbi:MAG: hypothetical protein AAGF85_13440 [Bacteroidota bacterium]
MSVRYFLISVGKFTIFQGLLISLLLLAYYRPSINGVSANYSSTNIKHKKLTSSESPRAIFVGGSNLMFGLESELIKERTDYEPVNMGLVGGLRLSFMLNEIKKELSHGDMVILALEYNQLIIPDDGAIPQVLMRIIEQRPQSTQYLNLTHWRLLLDSGVQEHVGIVLRNSIRRLFTSLPFFLGYEEENRTQEVNVYGDLITFRDQPPQQGGAYQEVLPDRIPHGVLNERIKQLNKFLAYTQKRNVDVVFTYPPIPKSQYFRKQEVANEFHQILVNSLDIPILGTPSDMVFDTDKFINESYHLHGLGIRERTQKLVNFIQIYEPKTLN